MESGGSDKASHSDSDNASESVTAVDANPPPTTCNNGGSSGEEDVDVGTAAAGLKPSAVVVGEHDGEVEEASNTAPESFSWAEAERGVIHGACTQQPGAVQREAEEGLPVPDVDSAGNEGEAEMRLASTQIGRTNSLGAYVTRDDPYNPPSSSVSEKPTVICSNRIREKGPGDQQQTELWQKGEKACSEGRENSELDLNAAVNSSEGVQAGEPRPELTVHAEVIVSTVEIGLLPAPELVELPPERIPGAFSIPGPGVPAATNEPQSEDIDQLQAANSDEPQQDEDIILTAPARPLLSIHQEVQNMVQNAPLVEGHVVDRKEGGGWGRGNVIRRSLRSNRFGILVLLAALLASVGAIIALAAERKRDDQVGQASALRPPSSLHPTESPSGAPTTAPASPNFVKLMEVVQIISSREDLLDPASPQFLALAWLADEDTRDVPQNNTNALIQRFVLATFFFSTGGDNWINNTLHLSERHECEWYGIHCFNMFDPQFGLSIYLSRNNLTGTLPRELFALKIEHLELNHNQIGGTIPSAICALDTNVREIWMSGNRLSGTIPDCFDALEYSFLQKIGFRSNLLTGTIPRSLNQVRSLYAIDLSVNSLSGSIGIDFEALSRLTAVRIWGNMLTGSIPSSIELFNGIELMLGENSITGTIPEHIARGAESRLRYLGLWSMDLTGTIPPVIFQMERLVGVTLGYCLFSGQIPQGIGSSAPSLLRGIGLENNLLTGTIPESFGGLTTLEGFNAHSNSFTGTIPASIGNLSSLLALELGNNDLVGSVPKTFANLTNLAWFSVSRNNLNGSLDFLCDMSISFTFADCKGSNAEVECGCCLVCCSDDEKTGCDNYIQSAEVIKDCSNGKHSTHNKDELCGADFFPELVP